MAKRRKFSRWRRLPGVYRFGEEKAPDPNLEPQRLTLFITGHELDRAELQASRLGFESAQDYCAELLVKALDAEHIREHVAELEAKRGTLEGLHEISDDPEYLADLSAAGSSRESVAPPLDRTEISPIALSLRHDGDAVVPPLINPYEPAPAVAETKSTAPVATRSSRATPFPLSVSAASLVVMRHAGQAEDDPHAFLPALRRGAPVPASEVAELAQALHDLELEHRDKPEMDRRLTFALHRLAFESQILHTDAWPGAFDLWTVDMLRAVQEAVERILSGQDIRYYPADDDLTPLTRPETLP